MIIAASEPESRPWRHLTYGTAKNIKRLQTNSFSITMIERKYVVGMQYAAGQLRLARSERWRLKSRLTTRDRIIWYLYRDLDTRAGRMNLWPSKKSSR